MNNNFCFILFYWIKYDPFPVLFLSLRSCIIQYTNMKQRTSCVYYFLIKRKKLFGQPNITISTTYLRLLENFNEGGHWRMDVSGIVWSWVIRATHLISSLSRKTSRCCYENCDVCHCNVSSSSCNRRNGYINDLMLQLVLNSSQEILWLSKSSNRCRIK